MVTNITAQTASTYLTYTPSNFAILTMIVGTHNKIDPNIYAIAIIFICTTKTFKRKTIEKIKNVILMTLATDLFACFSSFLYLFSGIAVIIR